MQAAGSRAAALSLLAAALSFLAACAASRPDIIQVGPWFAPRPPEEVELFVSRDDTRQPWGAIAIIHSSHYPAGARRAIDGVKKQARKMASEIGADGLIVMEEAVRQDAELGVYQEPEVYISALAFKYAANVSTSTSTAAPAK